MDDAPISPDGGWSLSVADLGAAANRLKPNARWGRRRPAGRELHGQVVHFGMMDQPLASSNSGGLPVIRAVREEEYRGREMIARHSDNDWSLCDAISFAMLDEFG